ncbi:MAG TPA: secretin N-terminal domain-containing protein [Candidatus Acidoferrum sp.]|nr:secretin N-terminal domain-containing protein [Candidatus Acidoferrum sp.]
MKTTTFALMFCLTALAAWAQPASSPRRGPVRINLATSTNLPPAPSLPPGPGSPAPTAPAAPDAIPAPGTPPGTPPGPAPAPAPDANVPPPAPKPPEEMIPAGIINFQGVDVNQVLDVYAKLVGRTLLRAGLPPAQIVLKTETPLTKTEAIQALQAVLALNGISLVNIGDKFVKVLPVDQANSAGAEFNKAGANQLPDMGSYVTRIVQLKYLKPSLMVPIIQPFGKLANNILAIDDNGILVLRDNAENVKRMMEMIEQVDVSVPAVYTNEVIAIKYAMAEDIANALNSLGGSGGSTVSFGSAPTASVSGMSRPGGASSAFGGGGMQGLNNPNQPRTFGAQTAPGGTTGASSFQQRLQSIMQRAGGSGGQQDQIQVFGQAKIIADQRSNSLLVFATQEDMARIKAVIEKLDVLLAQVLIEAVIIDVNLGNSLDFGVSAAQRQRQWSTDPSVKTAGLMNNAQPFYNFLNQVSTNGGILPGLTTSPNNFSYFGNIGNTWDIALQAAASDNNATVIQRPRIQTSQAKAATFFVGNTVPYITGTYYGGGYAGGNSSQYSQLSVGVELDVTPFINPDGLVVMDINQEIDDVSGYTTIDGNKVPNTNKRSLSSEIAVRDRDTIILGGFIRSDKSKSRTGVPILQDIPILGALFSSRSDSKNREELIVLMRPTVLKTPELASAQTIREGQRLPGVSAAVAQEAVDERKLIDAERKREIRNAKVKHQGDGFFNMSLPSESTNNATTPTGTQTHSAPATQ